MKCLIFPSSFLFLRKDNAFCLITCEKRNIFFIDRGQATGIIGTVSQGHAALIRCMNVFGGTAIISNWTAIKKIFLVVRNCQEWTGIIGNTFFTVWNCQE